MNPCPWTVMIAIALLGLCALFPQDDEQAPGRDWLLACQDAGGRWGADCFAKDDQSGDLGRLEDDVAATCLALWVMVGDGQRLNDGSLRADAAARGVRWLMRIQELDSGWIKEQDHALALRHHALATVVLCEFQYFSPGPLFEDACRRAVDCLVRVQLDDGGWGGGDTGANPRTTGWAVFALLAARDAGLDPRTEALNRGLAWLREHSDERGVLPSTLDEGQPDRGATALSILCHLLNGEEEKRFAAAWEFLLERVSEEESQDAEAWFLVAAASHRTGARIWKRISTQLKVHFLSVQRRGNQGRAAAGQPGSDVVETCWNALSLEVFGRYARLFAVR